MLGLCRSHCKEHVMRMAGFSTVPPARAARTFCLGLGCAWLLLLAFAVASALVETMRHEAAGHGTLLPAACIVGAIFLALAFWGAFTPSLGIHGAYVFRFVTESPQVALTFDDGPHPVHTRAVLRVLAARGARATFFVIGAKAAAHPDLIAEMIAAGHQIENHSWGHQRWFAARSVHVIAQDLLRTSNVIESLTGRRPRWARPPFGIASPPVLAGIERSGLLPCGWTRAARDGVSWQKSHRALARLRSSLRKGHILVMHDAAERGSRDPLVLSFLDELLHDLAERGLQAVTLDTLAASAARARPRIQSLSCFRRSS